MTPGARAPTTLRRSAAVLAAALAVLPLGGCESAVKHPAVTAGIVGGTLGFGTCKLASDNWGACAAVGGAAAGFLALVAATAIWLGGEGHSVAVEEQAQPLPDERPRHRRRAAPPGEPEAPATAPQTPTSPSPAAPAPVTPPAQTSPPAPQPAPPP